MRRIRKYLLSKSHIVAAIMATLSFIAFVTNFVKALSDGNLDPVEVHQLYAMADAFGAAIFLGLAFISRNK